MKKDLLDEADWDEELATTVGSRRSKRRKTVTISARRTSICTPPVEGPRPDLRLAEFQVDVIDFDDILYSELTEWAEERIKALQKVARSDGEVSALSFVAVVRRQTHEGSIGNTSTRHHPCRCTGPPV
jgi:hypothetical protein